MKRCTHKRVVVVIVRTSFTVSLLVVDSESFVERCRCTDCRMRFIGRNVVKREYGKVLEYSEETWGRREMLCRCSGLEEEGKMGSSGTRRVGLSSLQIKAHGSELKPTLHRSQGNRVYIIWETLIGL